MVRTLLAAALLLIQATVASADVAELWTGGHEAATRRQAMLALLAAERRRDPAGADAAAFEARFAGPNEEVRTRAAHDLTDLALAYLARRAGGPVPAARALAALRRLDRTAVEPPLALALAELDLVASLGGWAAVATVPGPAPTAAPLRLVSPELDVAPTFPPRKRLPALDSLRRRLVQSGDLSARYVVGGDAMDVHTADAIRLFQARHGLAADGVVGPRTLAALNAPVADEIARARVNLARGPDDRTTLLRYVEVNVPGYELRLVEGGRVVLTSKVIVGDEESATPIFDDLMRTIEINPFWYVPRSIEAELVEKEALKPGYLASNGFYWRGSTQGDPERLIQRPGPENALGRVKFLFPNHHAVYLHDTPRRGAFGRSRRDLSHGCVRVEKPFELALALLRPQGWDAKRLDAAFATAKTRRIELAAAVPVFLDYRTAFVDEDGHLQLRADLYGHDAGGVTRFAGKGLPPDWPPGLATPASDAIRVRPLPLPDGSEPAAQADPSALLGPA